MLPNGVLHNLDKSQPVRTYKAHTTILNQCQAMLNANSCSRFWTSGNFLDARLDVSIFKSIYGTIGLSDLRLALLTQ